MTTTTGAESVFWDLSKLYAGPDDPALQTDVDAALEQAQKISEKYHGKVGEMDASGIADLMEEIKDVGEQVYRAGAFASLRFSTDTGDPERGALLQQIQEKSSRLQTILLFMQLEWVAIEDDRANELLASDELAPYRHYLESVRRFKPYVLTEAEEKIMTETAVTGSVAWSRLFTELTSAMKVTVDDETVPLEEALSFLLKPDRDKRRRTAEAITTTLETDLRTRTFIYNTLLLDKSTDDRLRQYPHWLAARNLSNEATDESVQALIDAVVDRYDIPQRFYKLKAKILGLDKLTDYDRNATIAQTPSTVNWDEARKMVVDAYHAFSPDAGKVIEKSFDEKWIDAAIVPNKAPGAFCATYIPDAPPYVLLNYTGDRNDVLTLAHELGHALHGYLAQPQGYYNANTPLTIAETASVFGEALTFNRLVSEQADDKVRLELLTTRIQDSIGTTFRQVAMNRFEDAAHNARREEGELSADRIGELWMSTQNDMMADSVDISEGYKVWWSYVPHFIGTPGYVYAYAFGFLFSLAIYTKYQREGDAMVEPYLNLLKAGGSQKPEDLSAIVGLDITDPKFWHTGLEEVDRLVTEAEELAEKVS